MDRSAGQSLQTYFLHVKIEMENAAFWKNDDLLFHFYTTYILLSLNFFLHIIKIFELEKPETWLMYKALKLIWVIYGWHLRKTQWQRLNIGKHRLLNALCKHQQSTNKIGKQLLCATVEKKSSDNLGIRWNMSGERSTAVKEIIAILNFINRNIEKMESKALKASYLT